MSAKHFISCNNFRPLHDNVFVTDIEQGPTLSKGGLLLPDDNMTDRGIRDRWARIWAIGPEVIDLNVGEWVLVKHGRWTIGIDMNFKGERMTIWKIDYPEAILLASSEDPRNLRVVL